MLHFYILTLNKREFPLYFLYLKLSIFEKFKNTIISNCFYLVTCNKLFEMKSTAIEKAVVEYHIKYKPQ